MNHSHLDYLKEVSDPYNTGSTTARRGLMIGGEWHDDIYEYIEEREIRALYINSAQGWVGNDFSFLDKLSTIEELSIINKSASNLDAIESMQALESVQLTCDTQSVVDFSRLPSLQDCYIYWWAGAESIFEAKNLRGAYFDKIADKDLARLKDLQRLKKLTIANSNVASLQPLCAVRELSELELLNCRRLSDFEYLPELVSLRRLTIRGSKNLSDLEVVGSLRDLEVLVISDNKDIGSLKPLAKMTELKALAFAGNTIITDGDLSVLTKLPKLSMLMFASRRHYTHKLVKNWNWNNFDQPDTLLQEK